MRDIKFRIWDKQYKYMNYKVLVGMWGDNVIDDENYSACSIWIDPKNVDYKCEPHWCHFEPYDKDIELMQYTGIKDKNNKEIYEGDIVEFYSNIEDKIITEKVEYHFGIFRAGDYFLGKIYNKCEVIGNIYKNAELLV